MIEPLSFSGPDAVANERNTYTAAFIADILDYRSDMTRDEMASFLLDRGYHPERIAAHLDPAYAEVKNFHDALVDKLTRST